MSAHILHRALVAVAVLVLTGWQTAAAQDARPPASPASPVIAPVPPVPPAPPAIVPLPVGPDQPAPALAVPAPVPPGVGVPVPVAPRLAVPSPMPAVVPPLPMAQTGPVPAPGAPRPVPVRPASPPQPAAPPAWRVPAASGPALRGFNVVLVLGSTQGGSISEEIPPAAQRALSDMKDFLPYRSYRLLDAAWVLVGGSSQLPVQSLVRGPDGRQYEVSLARLPQSPPGVYLRFILRDVSPVQNAALTGWKVYSPDGRMVTLAEAQQDRLAALERELERARARLNADHPEVLGLQAELASERRRISEGLIAANAVPATRPEAAVISTSFTMDVGETVVVGTSRVGGDTALIALLTAVPRGAR